MNKIISSITFKILQIALLNLLFFGSALAQEDNRLNIYSWSNYIGKDTISNFEKEFKIKVKYDQYDSNETLHNRMVSGRSGYDLVLPSIHWAKVQASAGIFRKINKSEIPNLKNVDPLMRQLFSTLDPGNQYFVNWLWGFTTIGINTTAVKKALEGIQPPENDWELIFNPIYAQKMAGCGIAVLDSASEVVPAVMKYLGKDPYSQNTADYQDVGSALKAIRPYIKHFSSSDYIEYLATGGICVAMGWSGDLNIAKQRAIKYSGDVKIDVLIPKTGGLLFFDMMGIPSDSVNSGNAHKFINYILRPEVHASLTNSLYFANANMAAKSLVHLEIQKNTTVYLPVVDIYKMAMPKPQNNDIRRQVAKIYSTFKNGI